MGVYIFKERVWIMNLREKEREMLSAEAQLEQLIAELHVLQ